jgi:hypothetical protein
VYVLMAVRHWCVSGVCCGYACGVINLGLFLSL